MAKTSKFYKVKDIDALRTFNKKAVHMGPVIDNALVLRLLRDFDEVPGVERLGQQETETETAAQNAEATKPEATAPIELTLKGWERAINNSATSDEARENSFKALKQFEGDSVAINTINIVTERRIEALKKAAGV